MKRLIASCIPLALLAACEEQSEAPSTNTAVVNSAVAATAAAPKRIALPTGAPADKAAALKLMHDRHENMERIGDALKASGQTLKSGQPDLAVVRRSAATIAGLSPQIPSWFPPGTGPAVGKTDAKAAIWEKPRDFEEKAAAGLAAALAFDAAAKSGDLAAIRARMGDLGKSCKACHDLYREED